MIKNSLPANGHSTRLPASNPDARLFNGRPQVGVGIYDGLSALLAEKWKFDFVWISSFCCSAAAGFPDVGIVGAEDIQAVIRVADRAMKLPIVVDIDAGYGDAVKAFHVADAMARAGAAALCIEDNPLSKRCSLYDGYERKLVSVEEHIARLRAVRAGVDQGGSTCRVIARTEALVAGFGVKEALRRATAYADAGADGVFIQSLDATGQEVLTFGREWKRRTPLFIAPTRMAHVTKKEFFAAGISHTIFANQGLRAAHAAVDRTFQALVEGECSLPIEDTITPVKKVAAEVGAQKVVALEALLAQNLAKPVARSAKKKSPRLGKPSQKLAAGWAE